MLLALHNYASITVKEMLYGSIGFVRFFVNYLSQISSLLP